MKNKRDTGSLNINPDFLQSQIYEAVSQANRDFANQEKDRWSKLTEVTTTTAQHDVIIKGLVKSTEGINNSLGQMAQDISRINSRLVDRKEVEDIYKNLMNDHKVKVLEEEKTKREAEKVRDDEISQLIDLHSTPQAGLPPVQIDDKIPFYKKISFIGSAITAATASAVYGIQEFIEWLKGLS